MNEESNIGKFTAADIEKYHRGLLSPKEKHALEKAALEDPFLADALEGYGIEGVNTHEDISELKEKLTERIRKAKAVPVSTGGSAKFLWWRAAAAILLMAGAGILVYQFGIKKHTDTIAQSEGNPSGKLTDSKQQSPVLSQKTEGAGQQALVTDKHDNTKESGNNTLVEQKKELGSSELKTDTFSGTYTFSTTHPVSSVPVTTGNADIAAGKQDVKAETAPRNEKWKSLTETEKIPEEKKSGITAKPQVADDKKFKPETKRNETDLDLKSVEKQPQGNMANNIFRGRILDAGNNPVPFAHITNLKDSAGTYADAKGNFNLISPDTFLNVDIRSVGFTRFNTQLRNRYDNNNIVLQEDRSVNATIPVNAQNNYQKSNARPAITVDEAEPEDGWGLYDTYLINNLKMPEIAKTKQIKGEVQVSFEVNKNGEIANLKITRSLCEPCDKEAIRLIKEGPGWKRISNKGRATVTISF